MVSIRRWYIYLVSAITVQGTAWAFISLLRKVFLGETTDLAVIALQIAVIIVALPLFLVHWLWGQRLAGKEPDERSSFPRRLYLYGMMAGFLMPMVYNANGIIRALLNLILKVQPMLNYRFTNDYSNTEMIVFGTTAVFFLAFFWGFHRWVKRRDDRLVRESDVSAVLRQLHNYTFMMIGLVMAAIGVGRLLARVFENVIADGVLRIPVATLLAPESTRLVVGLAVWLIFWRIEQRAFAGADERERESVVRKAYLYLLVFLGAAGVIIQATILLSDILKRLFDVGGSKRGLDTAVATILVCGAIWAYHAIIIRRDAEVAAEVGRQALVRRIYTYLMAGLGLWALLIGVAGMFIVLFQELGRGARPSEFWKDIPGFLAVFIVGLVVWFWHWWRASRQVAAEAPAGLEERRSFVRRFYLYFYVFVATLTLLGSVIYIVSQLLMLLLGARTISGLILDESQALSFAMIGVAIWLFHGWIIWQDGRLVDKAEAAQLKQLDVAVVDAGNGAVGQAIVERLHEKTPGAIVHPIGLTETAVTLMKADGDGETLLELLAEAEVIVGPWAMAVPGGYGGVVSADVAAVITASQAQKILLPEPEPGYSFVGVERWRVDDIAKEVANEVRALTLGEELTTQRGPATWVVVLIVLVTLCLLAIIVPSLIGLLLEGGF